MLYYLSQLSSELSFLNLFRYITFRAGGAVLTALLIAFVIGPSFINWLKRKQREGQPIRSDGPENHLLSKKGTPTMGGGMILLSSLLSTLLWSNLSSGFVWVALLVVLGFGLIGMADDLQKLRRHDSKGISAKTRLILESLLGIAATYAIVVLTPEPLATSLTFPLFKNFSLDLGWFYIAFGAFVIVAFSNAVNLTDGLDGLATVPVVIAVGVLALIAYLTGHALYAVYLGVPQIPGAGELVVFCFALIGSCLGFLWFNAPPAMVFMGDTGSLALGSALGTVSLITKHEIVLAIAGGLFVLEAVSVVVQVASFKTTGRRVFRMAPIHHHFEKKGWSESTIVVRFWIIAFILAIVGLSTLKLR